MAELIISTDKNGFVQVPLTTYKGYQETILQNIPDGEQEVVTKREISDFANAIISTVNDNFRTFINQQRENMERLANASKSASDTSDDKSTADDQGNATEGATDTSTSISENNPPVETEKTVQNEENEVKSEGSNNEELSDEITSNISTDEDILSKQGTDQNSYLAVNDIVNESLTTFSSDMIYFFSNLLNEQEETENQNIIPETVVVEQQEEQEPQQIIQNEIIENIDNSIVNVETNNISQVEEIEKPETLDIEASIGNIKSEVSSAVSDLLSSVELSNTIMVQPLEQNDFQESIDYISAGIDEIKDILKSNTNDSEQVNLALNNNEKPNEEETVSQQLDNQPEIIEPIPQLIEVEEKETSDKISNTIETIPQPETQLSDKILNSTTVEEKESLTNDEYDVNAVLDEMVAEDNHIREQLNIFNNNVENVSLRDDSELSKYLRETYNMAPLTDEYEKAVSIMEKLEQNTTNENINNESFLNENYMIQENVNTQSSISNNIIQVEEKSEPTQQVVNNIDTTELMNSFNNSINESTNMIISAINAMKSENTESTKTVEESAPAPEIKNHPRQYRGRQQAQRIGV